MAVGRTELLRTRGTVYLLGADDSQVAPLVCALTDHIDRSTKTNLAGRDADGGVDHDA